MKFLVVAGVIAALVLPTAVETMASAHPLATPAPRALSAAEAKRAVSRHLTKHYVSWRRSHHRKLSQVRKQSATKRTIRARWTHRSRRYSKRLVVTKTARRIVVRERR